MANTEQYTTMLGASNFAAHAHGATTYHDYRVTEIDTRNLEDGNVSLDAIRDLIQRVAKHVVVLKIGLGTTHDPALEMILSAFYVFGAPLLRKLIVHENRRGHVPGRCGLGQDVFRVLQRFTALEELELHGVHFSSAEYIEPFFVSTRALTTLVLNDINPVSVASLEVGPAFQRGLQHNKTLQKTSFVSTGMFCDDSVLQACLVGIRNNHFVQDLELNLTGIHISDTSISTVRELASGTTAQKLNVTGGFQALAEMMGGLSTNSSDNVQEVRCFLKPETHVNTHNTGLVQAIIGPFQAWNGSNKELPVFALRGVRTCFDRPFQSQHLNALFVGLRHVPISELVLSNCGIEHGEVPVLCELIRDAPLWKLDLSLNPIGAESVAEIIKAASLNPLIEHLSVARQWGADDENSDISNWHESIATLLIHRQLVYLDLTGWRLSGPAVVASLAGGVQRSPSLTSFKMPLLDSQSIELIENALKENYLILTLEMCIRSLFTGFGAPGVIGRSGDILHGNATIQFYLELNRLGRQHYSSTVESKSVPVGVLPHVFARLTGDKHCSPLYYFLCQTPPDLLAGQASCSSKRKAQEKD